MNISCTELLNIFDSIGGKLKVDYYTEKATLYPQNISCNIKPDNSNHLDKLVHKHYGTPRDDDDYSFYHLPLKNWKEDKLKKIHNRQLSVVGGFVIQYYIDKEGNKRPIKYFKKFVNENCDE